MHKNFVLAPSALASHKNILFCYMWMFKCSTLNCDISTWVGSSLISRLSHGHLVICFYVAQQCTLLSIEVHWCYIMPCCNIYVGDKFIMCLKAFKSPTRASKSLQLSRDFLGARHGSQCSKMAHKNLLCALQWRAFYQNGAQEISLLRHNYRYSIRRA